MVNQARCRPRSPVCVESRPRAGDSETTCCMLVGAGGGAAADGGANTLCEHAAAAARAARAARGLWVTYAGTYRYNMTYMYMTCVDALLQYWRCPRRPSRVRLVR